MRTAADYRQLSWDEVAEGDELPVVRDHIDVERIVASAAATWTLFAGHIDGEYARTVQGRRHIYMATGPIVGLLDRYVTGWAGPATIVAKRSVRMVSSICAGDDIAVNGTLQRKWLDEERGTSRPLVEIGLRIDHGDGSRLVTATGTHQLPRATAQ